MPIYMDVHNVPGVKAKEAAEAHRSDVLLEEAYGCKCMTYWIDEERGKVFCLIDAPDKEAVTQMHHQAHGLIPFNIIEVDDVLVKSFLGRVYDPNDTPVVDGLKILNDSSYRLLVLVKLPDAILLEHSKGSSFTKGLMNRIQQDFINSVTGYGGSIAKQDNEKIIMSFSSASQALSFSLMVFREFKEEGVRITVAAGDPVSESATLFGETLQAANCLSWLPTRQIVIGSSIRSAMQHDFSREHADQFLFLTLAKENLLKKLFAAIELNWQKNFSIEDFSKLMAMSASKLYRESVSLTGFSPNLLLQHYRLEKAKQLLYNGQHNISEVTFETGFSSPSYFIKCFKKQYGLLPRTYAGLTR